MCEGEPRKRIPYSRPTGVPAIVDEKAYTKNRCSDKARKINSIRPNVKFEVWFDQHYHIREQFGDNNGVRDGIDPQTVESLVLKGMKHLIAYSSILKSFTFINHGESTGRANRIVLQEETEDGLLNVVIEAHIIDIDTYEITVKTAMCTDNFIISDGQFVLNIIENESVLKRKERGALRDVYTL